MQIISITYDTGTQSYGLEYAQPLNDYQGYVVVEVSSTADGNPIEVSVQAQNADGSNVLCPIPNSGTSSLSPGGAGLYVAVDEDHPQVNVTVGGNLLPSVTVQTKAASPRILSTDPTIGSWEVVRTSGTIVVRNDPGNVEVYAQIDTSGTVYTISAAANRQTYTPINGVPLNAGTLNLSLNQNMSDPYPIQLIHQDGTTVNITDSGDDIGSDTKVLSADTSSGDVTLTVNNNSSGPIVVKVVDYEGNETTPDNPLQPIVSSTTSHLEIWKVKPEGGDTATPSAAPSAESRPPGWQDQWGIGPVMELFDDPVVVIKQTGCGSGNR